MTALQYRFRFSYIDFRYLFLYQNITSNQPWTASIYASYKPLIFCLIYSVIPGTQKIWVRTWGCSHNSSDGEYMAGQLAASGYKITGTLCKQIRLCAVFNVKFYFYSTLKTRETLYFTLSL